MHDICDMKYNTVSRQTSQHNFVACVMNILRHKSLILQAHPVFQFSSHFWLALPYDTTSASRVLLSNSSCFFPVCCTRHHNLSRSFHPLSHSFDSQVEYMKQLYWKWTWPNFCCCSWLWPLSWVCTNFLKCFQ